MAANRWTANEIEIAVARHFNSRQNIIVPNVSWGLGLRYEADMVVLRPSGWALEIEIKTTVKDIRADAKKRHQHDSRWFRQLWFAVPQELADCADIPARAGILGVRRTNGSPPHDYGVTLCRVAALNKTALRFDDDMRYKLMALGVMRIWSLKAALLRTRNSETSVQRRKPL